ncbi:MAG: PAS domain S-box protein [Ignavibacteriales bacterium]
MDKLIRQKQATTSSATNEELEHFFTLAQDLMCICATDGCFRRLNPAWGKRLGYQESELFEINFTELLHPDDVSFFKKYLQSLPDEAQYFSRELRIRCKDEKYRWILWNVTYSRDENLVYMAGKDITLRKLAEEEKYLLQLLSRLFYEERKLKELLTKSLQEISNFGGFSYAEAWMYDAMSECIKCTAAWYEHSDHLEQFNKKSSRNTYRTGEGLIGRTWVSRESQLIENIAADKQHLNPTVFRKCGLTGLLSLPVLTKDNTVALLMLYSSGKMTTDQNKLTFLSSVAAQLGPFIDHKIMEERLRRSEKLLSETQKITKTGSWEWDIQNDRVYWTYETYKMYGIDSGRYLKYKNVLDMLTPEDKKNLDLAVRQALENKKPYTLEHKIFKPGGMSILEIKGELVHDEAGKIIKLIGTVRDITSQKQTEEKLRKSEEYFRSLIENSLDVKSILDSEGMFLYISPSINKMLGYDPEELIGKNLIRYTHPEDVTRLIKVFSKMARTPESIASVEFRIKDKFSKWHSIESIMKNMLGNPAVNGIVINSRDITQRKDAENTIHTLLSISKKLNSTLNVDVLIDALVEEAIKLTNSESGCSGLRTAEGMVCKKFFLNRIPHDFEYCWTPGNGIPGRLLINKSPYVTNDAPGDAAIFPEFRDKFSIKSAVYVAILNSQGDVIGFLSVFNKKNDVLFTDSDKEKLTALSQLASTAIQNAIAYQKIQTAEFQLKNSREQLRRLSAHTQSAREEERTRISREIHDELGQALTGLKMDLSWLDKKLQNDGLINQALADKINAMYSLINTTIKSVRKISSELRPGVLDYLGLTAAIEWQAQEFQNRTGITCKIISMPRELELDQNFSTALFRIFQETLTNITRHANATAVEVSLRLNGGNIVLIIRDNGRGITDEEIINTKSFGLLGMRERAYLLGGEFTIHGTQNEGTTVTVTIPIGNIQEKGEAL